MHIARIRNLGVISKSSIAGRSPIGSRIHNAGAAESDAPNRGRIDLRRILPAEIEVAGDGIGRAVQIIVVKIAAEHRRSGCGSTHSGQRDRVTQCRVGLHDFTVVSCIQAIEPEDVPGGAVNHGRIDDGAGQRQVRRAEARQRASKRARSRRTRWPFDIPDVPCRIADEDVAAVGVVHRAGKNLACIHDDRPTARGHLGRGPLEDSGKAVQNATVITYI